MLVHSFNPVVNMASATSMPMNVILTFTAILLAVGISQISLYTLFITTFTGPGSYSRIFAIFLLLINLKNAPIMWHVRVWGAVLKHFMFTQRAFRVETGGPAALFQPTISSSRSPIAECDYNLHKSNSTYFSDLDVTRSHLVSALLRRGIQTLQQNAKTKIVLDPKDGKVIKGKWYIMLGAVQCSFKKEIKPYEGYEMWTRLLCWDRKWVYVVTHFVKKGAVKPDGYTLDTGSIFGGKPVKSKKTIANGTTGKVDNLTEAETGMPHKAIFASSISKYVMKLGRLTVHPEVVLDASGLLPSKPGGWHTMDGSVRTETQNSDEQVDGASGEWHWKRIEEENQRGLKYAEHFGALDGLQMEFSGSDRPALGEYRDLFW